MAVAEEYDVVIIGSGPGGYVAAIRCAQLGLKTACIEKDKLGGTCLNVGCIPSKALLHASHLYHVMSHDAASFGVEVTGKVQHNLKAMMDRKELIVKGFNVGIEGLFKKNKIIQIKGTARLISESSVEVVGSDGTRVVEARNIVLATGSQPIGLPFLPFDGKQVISSTEALSLKKVPKRMALIGGGVIGVELASVYRRLGAEITVVEMLDRICPGMDQAISKGLHQILHKQGMTFHLSTQVTEAKVGKKGVTLTFQGKEDQVQADVVLVAVGRRPYTDGLGLEEMGIEKTPQGCVAVDHTFRTSQPTVYALGDLIEGPMLAHKASEEGVAVAEIIAGHHPSINYMAIPSVIYTHPEAASVGFTEEEAHAAGLAVDTATYPFRANSRARCIGEEEGFVKVLADKKNGHVVGMHILGANASELIGEGMMAIVAQASIGDIACAPHAHPTLSEAIKEASLGIHAKMIHF